MTRERWMALCFALGSTCFLIGPFPGYVQLVGDSADAVTFFVGSILFTAGGALQSWLAWSDRRIARRRPRGLVGGHRPVRGDALLQRHDLPGDAHRRSRAPSTTSWSGGPTGAARSASSSPARSPIAPRVATAGTGGCPSAAAAGWWQPAVNLLGCIFFGISAVAGYLVPSTGSMLDQAAANWNTALGAACFLACALDTLHTDRASKMPLRHRLERLEHELEDDLREAT